MTVQQSPALCQELLPYSETDIGFVVCHGNLPCTRPHATTQEIADKYGKWGYRRALNDVLLSIRWGDSTDELESSIVEILAKGDDIEY